MESPDVGLNVIGEVCKLPKSGGLRAIIIREGGNAKGQSATEAQFDYCWQGQSWLLCVTAGLTGGKYSTNCRGFFQGKEWEYASGSLTVLDDRPTELQAASEDTGGIFGAAVINARSIFFLGLQNVNPSSLRQNGKQEVLACELHNGMQLTAKPERRMDGSLKSLSWSVDQTPLQYRFEFSAETLTYSGYAVPQTIEREVLINGKSTIKDRLKIERLGVNPYESQDLSPTAIFRPSKQFAHKGDRFYSVRGTNYTPLQAHGAGRHEIRKRSAIRFIIVVLLAGGGVALMYWLVFGKRRLEQTKQTKER
jgi:hypothetical protein